MSIVIVVKHLDQRKWFHHVDGSFDVTYEDIHFIRKGFHEGWEEK